MRSLATFSVVLSVGVYAGADDPEKILLDALLSEKATQRGESQYVRSAVARFFAARR